MPGEPSIRVFFAIELGSDLRAEVAEVVERLRSRARTARQRGRPVQLRWTRPEGWHVTLRFIGSTGADRVHAGGDLLEAARDALAGALAFDLRLGTAIGFPVRRPRVLALDPRPHEPFVALAASLECAARRCGFEPAEHAFTPHLTLARTVRGAGRGSGLRALALDEVRAPGRAVQHVADVALLRSELTPGGARYTPLERLPLNDSLHP